MVGHGEVEHVRMGEEECRNFRVENKKQTYSEHLRYKANRTHRRNRKYFFRVLAKASFLFFLCFLLAKQK